ncbi:MAG: ribosome-associated translation inhibitor RaiA [Negativicutes bacterium]|jgi:putative sigma-54 modulation protein
MSINVRGKQFEVTPAIKDYVSKHIGKITHYFDDHGDINVTLSAHKGQHIVEVTVNMHGYMLRGEEQSGDLYVSIDKVVEKLERQVRKHKTKLEKRFRGAGFKSEIIVPDDEQVIHDFDVVKNKKFLFKPMSTEEAILQMNLLHHGFFVYTNSETDDVSIVYKRKDGKYGIIEPE